MSSLWDKKWVIAVMAFLGSAAGTFLTHQLSESSKAKWQAREWKESMYRELILGSAGFLDRTPVKERLALQYRFIAARDLCRIHCPDSIVGDLNIFTDTFFSPASTYPGRDRDEYYRKLQFALRKDLWPDTKLTEKDFDF